MGGEEGGGLVEAWGGWKMGGMGRGLVGWVEDGWGGWRMGGVGGGWVGWVEDG